MLQRLLTLFLCVQLVFSQSAFAQSEPTSTGTAAPPTPASEPITATPIDLDLSSSVSNRAASALLSGGQTAAINVGGAVMGVTQSSMLTPAQFAALSQILSGRPQTLQLSSVGAAVGGTVCLSCSLPQTSVGNLVIPAGVQVVNDFKSGNGLNLVDLTQNGTFYAVSSNHAITNAVINAERINVNAGGLLSTVLPVGGLPGFSNLVTNLSLSLNANEVTNHGVISSAADLSMNAQTVNNIGTIAAQGGALNITNTIVPARPLVINNGPDGTLSALTAVNVHHDGDVRIYGGNLFATTVNLDAICGHLDLSIKDASGAFHVNAGTARIVVTDGTHGFNLASINITGDPDLIYNGTGNYTAAGFNSLGGVVDIVTTGSINFTGNINTTPTTTGNGGYVNLNAGTTINTQNIITTAMTSGDAGSITLTAGGGITTGNLTALGLGVAGADGAIDVNSGGAVSIGAIRAAGVDVSATGNVSLTGTAQVASLNVGGGAINLAAIQAGSGALTINGSGDVTLGSVQAGATNVTGSNVTLGGAINATSVDVTANGNIAVNAALQATTSASLNALGSGNITQSAGTITTPSLLVTTAGGSVGSTTSPISTAVGSLAANVGGSGSAYFNQAGAVMLGASSVGGTLKLATNSNFTLSAPVTASNLTIHTTGTNTGITINTNPTVSSTLTLIATGTGQISHGIGVTLDAPNLSLTSGSGSFGSAGTPFTVASPNVSVTTTGSAYITNTGAMTLFPTTVGGTLQAVANGNLSTNGVVSGGVVSLTSTAANGAIAVNGNLNGSTSVALTATGTGTITNPSGTITTPNLTMTAGTGDIGPSAFIKTAAANITVSTGGDVQISQTGITNLQSSTVGGDFYMHVNAPSLALNNVQTVGGNFILTGTGPNTSFIVNQNPNVGSSFGLNTSGTGTITAGAGVVISAPIVTLNSNSNIGTSASPLQISASRLAVGTNGSAWIENDRNLMILGSNAGGTLKILNGGNITTAGTITAANLTLESTATDGSIVLGANAGGTTSSSFIATGTGTITRTAGTITGGAATLTTAGGAIGTAAAPIQISSTTVNGSSGAGAIYLNLQTAGNVNNVSSGSLINITAASTLTTTGTVTAPTVSLQSTGAMNLNSALTGSTSLTAQATGALTTSGAINGGAVTLRSGNAVNVNSNVTGTTSVTVEATGAAPITTNASGLLTGPTVSLIAGSGNIGSAATSVNTAAGTLTASTTGNIYILNSGATTVGDTSAGSILQLASTGHMTVNGTLTGSSINLQTTANNANITVNTAVSAPLGLTASSHGTGDITFNQAISTTPTTAGNGGHVNITAGRDLNYNSINTASNGTAGSGIAGNVTLTAGGTVTGIGTINVGVPTATNGTGAGDVIITAGGVNVSTIDASNQNGDGGSIAITSTGDIVTTDLLTHGVGNGGGVNLTQSGGGLITVNGTIDTHSVSTLTSFGIMGGSVTIRGTDGVNVTGTINATTASGMGGTIDIRNRDTGDIVLADLDSRSLGQRIAGFDGLLNPSGGQVTLAQQGSGNIIVNGSVNATGMNSAFGGDVNVSLNGGSLTTTGVIDTSSANQTGGHVDIAGRSSAVNINTLGAATDIAINSQGGGNARFYAGNVRILPAGAAISINGDISAVGNSGAASASVVLSDASSIDITGNIYTSNGSGIGGNVLLEASGDINAMNVTTNGGLGGGVISASAGTGGTGNLVIGNLSSTGAGMNQSGGAITLTAGGDVTTGNVTANGAGAAFGGAITMVAGYQPFGALPGGTGNIAYGDISSTGAWGGNVSVVSLGTSGSMNNSGSSITTNATGAGGIAGSVSLSSPGVISVGNISAQANNGAASYGGSVFVSSGAAGTAVTASNINTSSAGTAGNVFLIVNPTSTISHNPANIVQTGTTVNTIGGTTSGYLFDNPAAVTPTANISGTMTASFGTTVTGYNPGGYITASDPNAQLTVNTNGDTRLFAPLAVLQGSATFDQLNSQSLTIGSSTYASPVAVYSAGDINIANTVSAISVNAPAPPVNFVSTTGAVNVASLTIQGDPAAQVVLSSPTSFTLSNGSSIFNSANGTGGLVTISVPNGTINLGSPGNMTGNTLEANGATGGIITLAASGDIANYGVAISATGTTGAGGTVNITSSEGEVIFHNSYGGGTVAPASIDVSSASGVGGTIEIYGRYGVSVLTDGVPGTPSTHVFQANGLTQGGSVTINSPNGGINLADNQSINVKATAPGGTAGSIYLFAPFGDISTNNLDASSDNGGSIQSISSSFSLSKGSNITAAGTNGVGGNIHLYTGGVKFGGGQISLGATDNRTGNSITASGTTGGGTVSIEAGGSIINYGVSLLADTTSGTGGNINLLSYGGGITFYNSYFNNPGPQNYNAQVSANSASGAGGRISMEATGGAISSVRDTSSGLSGNVSTHAITASGTTGGGSISMNAGSINLGDTDQVRANGTAVGSAGGSIDMQATGNVLCCYSTATSVISTEGVLTGGDINIESSGGHIDLTLTSKTTTSSAGTTGGITFISAPNSWVTTGVIDANVPGSTVSIEAGGTLLNRGIISGDVVDMRTISNNGSITLGAAVNGLTSVTMYAGGSGNIVNTQGYGNAVVTAPTVNLTSQSANVGGRTTTPTTEASLDPQFVFVNAGALTLNAGQNIFVNSLAPSVNMIGTSAAGTGNNQFMLESAGHVNIDGTVRVGSTQPYSGACCSGWSWVGVSGVGALTIETYGGAGDITVNGTASGYGSARFITEGTGKFSLPATGALNSNSNVYIEAYGADIQGTIFSQSYQTMTNPQGVVTTSYSGSVQLVPNGSQGVALGDLTGTADTFDVPQSVFDRITTQNLIIGSRTSNGSGGYNYVNTGDIKVYGDIDLTGVRGTAGVYSLTVYTGGNFEGTGHTVSLSTGAEDYNYYQVYAAGTIATGSASGGYYQYFYANGATTVDGSLNNTNSLYQYNQIHVQSDVNVNVLPTGSMNSMYSSVHAPVINVDGAITGSNYAHLYNYTYLPNNVPQPAYGLTLSGTGSVNSPQIYIEDYHYTYDPVTFASTFHGGSVNGTIGQLNGALSGYAAAGNIAGTGHFNLSTTAGDMQVRSITAQNSITLSTAGSDSIVLNRTSGITNLSSATIHLTTGEVVGNMGLNATNGAVLIEAPSSFGLTLSRTVDGAFTIGSTTGTTVRSDVAVTVGANTNVSTTGALNLTTPSLTMSSGAALSSTGAMNINNAQNISISGVGGSQISAPTLAVTSTNGSISIGAGMTGSTSMTVTAATGVTSTNTLAGLVTPTLNVNGGTGNISIARTTATSLTANATGAVSITDTAAGIITLNPSSGSSFTLNASNAAGGINGVGELNAPTISLSAGTGGINIATSGSFNADNVTVNAPTGAVNLRGTHAGIITLNGSYANGFTMTASDAASGINANGNLDSPTVALTAGSAGIDFRTAGSVNSSVLTANTTGAVNIDNIHAGMIAVGASSGSTFNLVASNVAGGLRATGALSAPTVSLTAGTNGIDYNTTGSLNANVLSANSTGAVNIRDTYAGSISLGASSATSFTLNGANAGSGIVATGNLNAGTANLSAGTGGIDFNTTASLNSQNLTVNTTGLATINDTHAGVVSLGQSSASSFVMTASDAAGGVRGTGTLASPTININTGTGGINFTGANSVNSTNVTLTSTGDVNVNDSATGNVTLNSSSAGAGSAFRFTSVGNLSDANSAVTVQGGTINLGSNGNVTLAGGYTADAGITLTAGGSVTSTNTSTGLSAPSLSATSGSASGINIASTSATDLTFTANNNGAVNITNTANGNVTLNGSTAGAFTFVNNQANSGLTANGAINVNSANITVGSGGIDFATSGSTNAQTLQVNSGGAVNIIDTNAGVVSVAGSTAPSFTLNATNATSTIRGTGVLNAADVSLTAGSGGINFATASSLNASNLSANTSGAVNIRDTHAGVVSLGASSAISFQLSATDAAGGILTTGLLDAASINLTAGAGGIQSSNAAPINATSVIANATGAVSLVDTATSQVTVDNSSGSTFGFEAANTSLRITNTVSGSTIDLTSAQGITTFNGLLQGSTLNISAGGDIGSAATPLNTQVGTITTSAGANQFISNTGNLQLGATTLTGDLTVTSTGNINVIGAVSNGGDMTFNTSNFGLNSSLASSDPAGRALVQHTGALTLTGTGSTALFGIDFNAPSITVAANYTFANGDRSNIDTNTLLFNAGASLNSSNANGFAITPRTGNNITITAPNNGTGTLGTAGGAIDITTPATGIVTFNKTAGTNTATLALNGGPVTITAARVNTAANVQVTSDNNISISTPLLSNIGTISSAQQLSVTNASGVTINGGGVLGGNTIALNSANGAVSVTQDRLNGIVSGSAGTNYTITTDGADLNVGSTGANNGSITLTATGFNLNVVDNSAVNASRDVRLHAGQVVRLGSTGGAGVTVNSGTLDGAVDPRSINRADYDYDAVTTPGTILISGDTGVTLGDNVSMTSRGDSIGILSSTGSINFGVGDNLFAQAGNIWINALRNVHLGSGAVLTSVARDIPNQTFFINKVGTITNYSGGDIGINVDVIIPNYDNWLRTNFDAQRHNNGIYHVTPGVRRTNLTVDITRGGTVDFTQNFTGKIVLRNSSFTADGGVIQIDPPGSTVTVDGATFLAIGPELQPLPPVPPTPPPLDITPVSGPSGPGPVLVPNLNALTVDVRAEAARSVPVDQTKTFSFQVQPVAVDAKQCVPNVIAPYNENGWSVAAGACQSFSVKGQDDSAIIGGSGASLASEGPNNVSLKKGSMVAMSGKNGMTVTTSNGTSVALPAETTVLVEETENGVVRVIQLAGQDAQISVNNGKEAPKTIASSAGEELVVAGESVDDEELIPVDGVERVAVGATLKFAGMQVRRNKFDPKRMMEQNRLLSCNQGCFPVYIRNRINKTRTAVGVDNKVSSGATSAPSAKPVAKTPLRPVAFTSPTVTGPAALVSLDSDIAVIKHLGAGFTMVSPNEMKLDKGEVVISADKAMTVRAGRFSTSLAKGAIAAVRYTNNVLQVRNVCDASARSVTVLANDHSVDVPVGGEVMMAEDERSLDKVLAGDDVGRRKVKRAAHTAAAVMSSEVSFVSIIQASALLNKLFTSGSDDDKTISDRIAKTAVALSIATARHGTFAPLKQ